MANVQWRLMGNWMYGAQASNSASGEGLADANMGMFNMPMTNAVALETQVIPLEVLMDGYFQVLHQMLLLN